MKSYHNYLAPGLYCASGSRITRAKYRLPSGLITMQPTLPGTIGAKFATGRSASKSGTAVDTVRHGARPRSPFAVPPHLFPPARGTSRRVSAADVSPRIRLGPPTRPD